jgi:FtsH-binding integral membrane protein
MQVEPPSIFTGLVYNKPIKTHETLEYHVSIVYRLVSEMLLAYIVGIYLTSFFGGSGITFYISMFGSFVTLAFHMLTTTEPTKYYTALGFAGTLGYNAGYVIRTLYQIDPGIVISATAMTFTTFVTFTCVANYVNQFHMLALYGFLSSMFSGLCIIGLINIFYPFSDTFMYIKMICGLITFSGFVTYDTYKMYDKFVRCDFNYYRHTINIFLDLVNLFIEFLKFFAYRKDKKKNLTS